MTLISQAECTQKIVKCLICAKYISLGGHMKSAQSTISAKCHLINVKCFLFMRLFSLYIKMSSPNVRFRSSVDFPVYVRFSSAKKFTVHVAHYWRLMIGFGFCVNFYKLPGISASAVIWASFLQETTV